MKGDYKMRGTAKKFGFVDVIKYLILILWACTTVLPLLWVLNNSFKESNEILLNPMKLPSKLSFFNYSQLISYGNMNIFRGFLNSLIISGSVVLLVLLFGGFAAYVIARFDFKLTGIVKVFFTGAMLVPAFSIVIPSLVILRKLGLNGSYLALILPQTAGLLPFATLTLAGFMKTLPVELEEAAIIDGAGVLRIFFRIIVPLSIPGLVTAAIFVFLWSYNDLFMSLIFIPIREKQPICVLLSLVSSVYGTNYGAMMAALIITVLPVIILYVFLQEYVIKGMTAGAVKG
jgi:raffinose/stachyose/melibiose transport system permease protein